MAYDTSERGERFFEQSGMTGLLMDRQISSRERFYWVRIGCEVAGGAKY